VRLELTAVAELELDEAVAYYNTQRDGLGAEFADEARQAMERIASHPRAWQPLEEGVRRCRLNRFPYGLVYAVEGDIILVVAVMFLRRDPIYWRDRLKKSAE
jgi:toxin ParE2